MKKQIRMLNGTYENSSLNRVLNEVDLFINIFFEIDSSQNVVSSRVCRRTNLQRGSLTVDRATL